MAIRWYGERGIINALVCELDNGRDFREFLRLIQWAGGGQPAWIEQVESVVCIVEPHFADFGSPDLIMVCKGSANSRNVVFIEAKAGPYQNASFTNVIGMEVSGFNSRINGQLSLRFRCSVALQLWDGQVPDIREPIQLLQAYRRTFADGGLADPREVPRHVEKPGVLNLVREALLFGLHGECYHLVAMTSDTQPFWETIPADLRSALMPRFRTLEGEDAWHEAQERVGWIGLRGLAGALNLGAPFQNALATILPPVPAVAAPQGAVALERLQTINWNNFELLYGVRDRLLDIARPLFGFGIRNVDVGAGSSSISQDGRVIIKLVPQNPANGYMYLGVTTLLDPTEWLLGNWEPNPVLIGAAGNQQPFYVQRLPAVENAAVQIGEEIMSAIHQGRPE